MKKILWAMVVLAAVAMFMTQQNQPEQPVVTKTELGGAFSLIGTEGQSISSDDFSDKYMLVFFGFTFCPDICPTTLTTISTALEQLDDENPALAAKLAPIFITVDPERDTPEVMKEYMSNFDARITGLTGSRSQVRAVADAYKVYYALQKQSPEDTDYLVDHTGYVYLMNSDGDYLANFTHDSSVGEVIALLNEKL